MKALLSDPQLVDRLLQHIDQKTTDRSDRSWQEPVSHYRCPERFQAELELLRRATVPFCASASIAEPGAYVARSAAGTPLVAARGDDGKARVFRNACRHRGMPVAQGSACSRAFRCRYHGWTYELDGRLRHVPHQEGFPGLDKSGSGLSEVSSVEQYGLIFVSQAAECQLEPEMESISNRICAQHRQFDSRERSLDANWKVFVETFLEGYHIKAAHKETFLPFGYDNTNVVEHFGRNSRVTFPFQRIEKQRALPAQERQILGNVTMVYHLFPNAVLVALSHHLNLLVIEPVAIDRSVMHFYSLAHESVSDERARKDTEFVDQTGTAEDREIACAIQRGLGSGANKHFSFGQFEGAISHFHANLAEALDSIKTAQS